MVFATADGEWLCECFRGVCELEGSRGIVNFQTGRRPNLELQLCQNKMSTQITVSLYSLEGLSKGARERSSGCSPDCLEPLSLLIQSPLKLRVRLPHPRIGDERLRDAGA